MSLVETVVYIPLYLPELSLPPFSEKTVNIFSSEREIEDGTLHRWFLEIGSEVALRLLMQKYYKPICSHVFAILKDHQDADEITNETFLKAFNERETIKFPDKLVGWLYNIKLTGFISFFLVLGAVS